jgi:hypothetical protein
MVSAKTGENIDKMFTNILDMLLEKQLGNKVRINAQSDRKDS